MSAPYRYGMVPSRHRTAIVQSHSCTVQWLYGYDVGQSIGGNQQRKMYGKGACRTVAVRGTHMTILRLYADTDDRILPIQPVKADSKVGQYLFYIIPTVLYFQN